MGPHDKGENEGARPDAAERREGKRQATHERQERLATEESEKGGQLVDQLAGTNKNKENIETKALEGGPPVLTHWKRQAGFQKGYSRRKKRKKNNARQGRQGEFCMKEGETGPKGEDKEKRAKAGMQGGHGEEVRSLPLTLQGCDSDITSMCAGPQDDTGKEQDDDQGIVGDDGDAQPHIFVFHVQQPGTYGGRATGGSEGLKRWPPARRKQAGHGVPGIAGGGKHKSM